MPDIALITSLVTAQENSPPWAEQASLMDEALRIWELKSYLTLEAELVINEVMKFTSNNPRTFADMVVAMLSEANIVPSIPVTDQQREERDVDSQKERFAIGCLQAGDERLEELLLPSLQDVTAWQSALRGRLACAWLLGKDKDENTYVHVMPWDSRYTFWGTWKKGLRWRCHRVWKTVAELETEYEVSLDKERDKVEAGPEGSGAGGLEVYDWYDDEVNQVITAAGRELKKATPHGSPRVPVTLAFVGHVLPLSNGTNQVTMRGQDIYHSLREVFKMDNFLTSAHATRVAREIDPNYGYYSKTGEKHLTRNPMEGTGQEVALTEGEKVEVFKQPEVSRESMMLEARISLDRQRGSVPEVAYGTTAFPMPGVAIEKLRQPMSMVLSPCQKAIESIYKQGLRLLCDQYATGKFSAFEVSGRDRQGQRRYFKLEISPEVVRAGGDIGVEMLLALPQDEPGRWATYAAARQPDANGIPGISQRTGLEKIVKIPDVELEMSAIMTEMANRFSPWALADEMIKAAERQGDETKAKIYLAEAMIAMRKKQMELAQLGLKMASPDGSGPGENGGGNGRGLVDRLGRPLGQAQPLNKGFPPTVLHGAQVGNPPAYNPAEGPQVPPGSLRPGDMDEEQEMMLRSLGLM